MRLALGVRCLRQVAAELDIVGGMFVGGRSIGRRSIAKRSIRGSSMLEEKGYKEEKGRDSRLLM